MWSLYIQLKSGYSYFRSYLKRLPDYNNNNRCGCNISFIQSPAHLLLSYSNYIEAYSRMREKLSVSQLSLKILLTKREGIKAVFSFLKETKIATRN